MDERTDRRSCSGCGESEKSVGKSLCKDSAEEDSTKEYRKKEHKQPGNGQKKDSEPIQRGKLCGEGDCHSGLFCRLLTAVFK